MDDHGAAVKGDRHVIGPELVLIDEVSGQVEIALAEPGGHVRGEGVEVAFRAVVVDKSVGVPIVDDESRATGRDRLTRARQVRPSAAQ